MLCASASLLLVVMVRCQNTSEVYKLLERWSECCTIVFTFECTLFKWHSQQMWHMCLSALISDGLILIFFVNICVCAYVSIHIVKLAQLADVAHMP